jgi:hypothetical protein
MDKNAKELIQKMAFEKLALSPQLMGRASYDRASVPVPSGQVPKETLYTPRMRAMPPDQKKQMIEGWYSRQLEQTAKQNRAAPLPSLSVKTASMKNIIDDLVKGAQQNTFGRPVTIQQGFNPSPLDLSKFAGALAALDEQGYSVKEAAEYLGLTEKQVQDIVARMR